VPILNQDHRLIHTISPLGADAIITRDLSGTESISSLFHFNGILLSDNLDIKQSDIVGKSMTFSIFNDGPDEDPRFIDGYVNEFSSGDVDATGLRQYSASIVPGLWFTQLGSNNRIFSQKTAKEILEEVIKEYAKVINLQVKLTGTYTKREYTTQFDETDFEFISRLMAEEGISYYFTHESGKHSLVLSDDAQNYFDCIGSKVKYSGGGSLPTEHTINNWNRKFSYHGGAYETKDYSEFATTKDQKQNVATKNKLNDASPYIRKLFGLGHFELDAEHKRKLNDGENKTLTQRHMEADECRFESIDGASGCCLMTAGGRFSVDHTIDAENGKYLLTSVTHQATDGGSEDSEYTNTFTCIPTNVNPRPSPLSCAKKILNPQVAEVLEVKATDSTSSVDPYTQVKVKFPWNNEQSSCWVRVVQSYSGKNWGANFVPRIAQEVVINYINGDPDRPIVTGAVYNKTNPGPNYTATQSGFKTQYEASKFNELRFDDKVDNEEIYMEAGKNHTFLVHNDQAGIIEKNQSLEVIENRDLIITNGDETKSINTGSQTLTIKKDQTTAIDGDNTNTIKGKQTTSVTKAVLISSDKSIELKVGSSSIKLTPSGITIKGVKLTASGSSMAEVKGGGMLTLKGGITKIN
jgi:type VI secretion system secreted protein VgrG